MSEGIEEALDPRVQDQLESLNICTDKIIQLELKLDEANAAFRSTLSESSQRLKQISKRLGKCITIARPYYESKEAARQAQIECQKAAVKYQRACSIHKEARETITMAEEKFLNKDGNWKFDTAWQEMVNHASMKVLEAEALKLESEYEHQRRVQMCANAEETVQILAKQLKHAIIKSRPYFEEKLLFQQKLQDLKVHVDALQKSVSDAKSTYSKSLHNLEAISKEIHERRKLLQPREPGVGAELENALFDLEKYCSLDNFSQADSDSVDHQSSVDSSDGYSDKMPELNLNMLEVRRRSKSLSPEFVFSKDLIAEHSAKHDLSLLDSRSDFVEKVGESLNENGTSAIALNLPATSESLFVEIDLNGD